MSLLRRLTARTIRFGALFAVFSLCLLLLSGLSQAGPNKPRPFKADVHGGASPWPSDNPVYVHVDGEGTHLGRFGEDLTHYINLDFSFTGHAVFTAANGDTFETDFSGQLTPMPGSDWATFHVHHTIVRGTGRFHGASGSFDGTYGFFNMVTGEDLAGYDGTISY